MKTLQNNFTTPEQSKKLLELGVPVDSADCFYSYHIKTYAHSEHTEITWIRPRFITDDNNPNWNARLMDGTQTYLPCWTDGRLMKIIEICSSYKLAVEIFGHAILYYDTINGIISEMAYKKGSIDFSKLEE